MNIYQIFLFIALFFYLFAFFILFQLLLSFGKYKAGDNMSKQYRKKSIKKINVAITCLVIGTILGIIVILTGTS